MNQQLINASENGDVNVVRRLLSAGVDPAVFNNEAIRFAARNGRAGVVQLLLEDPRVDPTANDNEAIRSAAHNGHVEVVRLLLADPRVDPTADYNEALRSAVLNKHVKVVWLLAEQPGVLISTVNYLLQKHRWTNLRRLARRTGALSDSQEDLMVWGAAIGSLPLVTLLVRQGVDVTFADNSAMAAAQQYNHPGIVSYLSNL